MWSEAKPSAESESRQPVTPARPAEITAPLPVLDGVSGRLSRFADRWLPASWRHARLDPSRPGALALVLVGAIAAVLAAVGVWRDRPVAEAPPALSMPARSPSGASAAPGASLVASAARSAGHAQATAQPPRASAPLVVSVAGRVRRPGLVQVPDGARVADAIARAGGALPGTDLTRLNLARRVADGEQVLVGVPPPGPEAAAPPGAGSPGQPGPGTGTGESSAPPEPDGKIDLNRATVEQLDTLPGVGPVTARRIVEWRTQHGRFNSVDQLREIDGIGERRLAQLRVRVTV